VVPVGAADLGAWFVAGGQPYLGEITKLEVIGGVRAAHPGGHPAGVDRVAADLRPVPCDGEWFRRRDGSAGRRTAEPGGPG
jgi:hypothetical protein